MNAMKTSRIVLTCFFLSLTSGCKVADDDSKTASLDELSGSVDGNKAAGCSGTFSGTSFKSEYPALAAAYDQNIVRGTQAASIETALSAVPNGLKAIFLGLGYRLVYTDKMSVACNADADETLSKVLSQGVASCATSKDVSDSEGELSEEITLYVSNQEISTSTVLAMIGVVSKKLGRVDVDSQGDVSLLDEEESQMRQFKESFAMSALHEGLSKDAHAFDLIADLLPQDESFTAGETSSADRTAIFRTFMQTDPDRAELVLHEIFDNAADSVYCNKQTRDSFTQKFNGSAAMWASSIHTDITDGEAFSLTASAESPSVSEESYGLWGFRQRPLQRFQPIRNAFRLRNNQMATNFAQTGFRRPRLAGFRRPFDGSGTWRQPPAWGSGQRIGWRWR